tara:strand:+ start:1420 stop:1701 length:282 start_codon:yes stop_codon:yes gene_type:complete
MVTMTRLLCSALPFLTAFVLISPASAIEPLQHSQASSAAVASSTTTLDLSSEQAHFSDPSKRLADVDNASTTPVAPGEKGRPPAGHSVLDLSF